jgi:hypothetical protein
MNNESLQAQVLAMQSLLKDAAIAMATAHNSMFEQCASNPVKNAWDKEVNVLAINNLQDVANRISKALGDFDVTSVVYGEPKMKRQEEDFEAYFVRKAPHHGFKPVEGELHWASNDALKSFARDAWDRACEVKDTEIATLKNELAMALDAANKGDSARMMAGGMEMTIGELTVEVAKRDILLADMLNVFSSLSEAAISKRVVKGYRQVLDDMQVNAGKQWDGKTGDDHDLLPPVGSTVSIHLGREDKWVNHVVTGYYVWGNLGEENNVHRVFVRVRDAQGYPNARMLNDVRPAGYVAPVEA